MSRLHPFDCAFGTVAEDWFVQIAAAGSASEMADFARFAQMPVVTRLLETLQPGDTEASAAEATEEYLRFLYAAFHFHQAGKQTTAISRDRLERQMSEQARNSKPFRPTASASYYQLPERWFWAQVSEGSPHEPVD